MCGRFALYPDHSFYSRFSLAQAKELSSYPNASPGQQLPLVVSSSSGNQLVFKLWGYQPSWSASSRLLINARAETVSTKPAFNKAFTTSRCLIPASGYYEWQKTTTGSKPYYFQNSDLKYLGLAGIYFDDSFVILTRQASVDIASIHSRMPLILPPASESSWLNPSSPLDNLTPLLTSAPFPLSFSPV